MDTKLAMMRLASDVEGVKIVMSRSKVRQLAIEGASVESPVDFGDELLQVSLRFKRPDSDESTERKFPLAVDASGEASADLNWSAAVASFGMLLRDSRYRGEASYDLILDLARAGYEPGVDERRDEFVALVSAAKRIDHRHPLQTEGLVESTVSFIGAESRIGLQLGPETSVKVGDQFVVCGPDQGVETQIKGRGTLVDLPSQEVSWGELIDGTVVIDGGQRIAPGDRVVFLPAIDRWTSAEAREQASAHGMYSDLLDKVERRADIVRYGRIHDDGHRAESEYAGRKGLPPAHWVYVYPDWYLWATSTTDSDE
jgi:hypothetical protein